MSLYGLDPDDMFAVIDRTKKAEELVALLREVNALPREWVAGKTGGLRGEIAALLPPRLHDRIDAALAKVGPC